MMLCFDGTGLISIDVCITNRADSLLGNKFLGNDSDTNIAEIYQMLDKKCPNQYYYYQRNSS